MRQQVEHIEELKISCYNTGQIHVLQKGMAIDVNTYSQEQEAQSLSHLQVEDAVQLCTVYIPAQY